MLITGIIIGVLFLCIAAYLLCLQCGKKQDFQSLASYYYAHRGLHDSALGVPENSLKAFRLAVENGYGAELDVHLSKDGKLVVMHDESLKRTASVDKLICDCTKAELDALSLENTDEKIPFLEEVFPIFAGKTPLVIELKAHGGNHAALARKTCAMLNQYPDLEYCIESFDPRVLNWLRKHKPNIIRGQLSCDFLHERNNLSLPLAVLLTNLLTNVLARPHFIAYKFEDRRNVSLSLCKKLWSVQEVNWTIRSNEDASTSLNSGAMIIFEHCRPEYPEKR